MRTTAPRVLLSLLLMLVATTAAGCTEDSGTDRPGSTLGERDEPSTEQAKAPGLPKGVKGATDVPSEVPNDADLRDHVRIEQCRSTKSGWVAKGTATNPSSEPASYTVTVFFTTSTATVIGTGSTDVEVEAKDTATWQVADEFKAPKGTRCVLRGVG